MQIHHGLDTRLRLLFWISEQLDKFLGGRSVFITAGNGVTVINNYVPKSIPTVVNIKLKMSQVVNSGLNWCLVFEFAFDHQPPLVTIIDTAGA